MFKTVINPTYNELFCKWLSNRFPTPTYFDPNTTRCVAHVFSYTDADGNAQVDILAVAAFHRWSTHAVEVTIASSGEKRQKATAAYIYDVMKFVFESCNRTCLYATISQENTKSIAVAHMLGLTQNGEIPDFFGEGVNARVYSLTKSQWKQGPWANKPDEAINIDKNKKDLH